MFNKVDVKSLAVWSYQRGRVDALREMMRIIQCNNLEKFEGRFNFDYMSRQFLLREEKKLKEVE